MGTLSVLPTPVAQTPPISVPDNFMIIAHRGASGYAPEHTRAAFDRAIECGANEVELDVQLSADGAVVLCHDESLDAYGYSGQIKRLSYYGKLERLDMGRWKGAEFSGQKMMTLCQLFAEYERKFRYHIELKSKQLKLSHSIYKIIKHFGMENNVVLTSGHSSQLNQAKIIAPGIPRAYLVHKLDGSSIMAARGLRCEQICPRADTVTWDQVKKCRDFLPTIRAWGISWQTSDPIEQFNRLNKVVNSGCDGTTLDMPDQLVRQCNLAISSNDIKA